MDFYDAIQIIGKSLDGVGIVVMVLGIFIVTIKALPSLASKAKRASLYRTYRSGVARSILLGLEFLVAGDIIRTITGTLNLGSVIALAIIVLIRTLLSLEFETEIAGRWPWKRSES